MEWELAARWRTEVSNTVGGFRDPWFTQGDSASGAAADYTDAGASGTVAWYNANSESVTHNVKGKTANSLGLYDMGGNVREWSFDWHPLYIESRRGERGGSWVNGAELLQVGYVYNDFPYYEDDFIGFRFSRTP
jgi:formylglycine-generating enzyme required for sulfatase activity